MEFDIEIFKGKSFSDFGGIVVPGDALPSGSIEHLPAPHFNTI